MIGKTGAGAIALGAVLAGAVGTTGIDGAGSPAATAAEPAKQTKAERIEILKKDISGAEYAKRSAEAEIESAKKAGKKPHDGTLINQRVLSARIESARTEIAWLEGRLTKAGAETRAKAAEEALKKAEDAKSDETVIAPLKAELDVAKRELAAVVVFETKGEF